MFLEQASINCVTDNDMRLWKTQIVLNWAAQPLFEVWVLLRGVKAHSQEWLCYLTFIASSLAGETAALAGRLAETRQRPKK
jgi:hypothetical protein